MLRAFFLTISVMLIGGTSFAADMPHYTTLVDCVRKGTPQQLQLMLQKTAAFPVEQRTGSAPYAYTPLFEAVQKNNAAMVRMLLAAGADANAFRGYGTVLSHALIHKASPQIVQMLLDAGAEVNPCGLYGMRATYYAVNNPAVLKLLLDAGASPSEPCRSNGVTPLMQAVSQLNIESVKLLLKYGADLHARDANGGTVLFYIPWTTGRALQMAQCLIEHGADVNARDNKGRTPLLASPGIGRSLVEAPSATSELLDLYLSAGASLLAVDANGCNALEYALSLAYRSPSMEKILTERGLTARPDYELLAAVKATTPERAKAWLAQGASPNARGPQDAATALDHCQGTLTDPNPGAADMIELLLAAGAEPDAADDNGNTPLSRAVRFGSLRAVKALIDAGADVKRADYMNIAWPREWPELESLLLASGAAPRLSARPAAELAAEARSLLDSATRESVLRLFALCSQGGFDINTPLPGAPSGCTALMLAAQRGDIQLVRCLLAMGARAEVQDAAGQNAVDYASVAAQPDIVSLLRKTYVPAE